MKKVLIPGILAGATMFVMSLLMGPVTHFLFPSVQAEYQNPALFRAWSDPLMSLYFLQPFMVGLILAWVWDKTKGLFKKNDRCPKGLSFALIYWVTTLPGMFMSFSSFPISLAMVITWSLSILAQALVAGVILTKFNQ